MKKYIIFLNQLQEQARDFCEEKILFVVNQPAQEPEHLSSDAENFFLAADARGGEDADHDRSVETPHVGRDLKYRRRSIGWRSEVPVDRFDGYQRNHLDPSILGQFQQF